VYFRRKLRLTERSLRGVRLFITARSRYELYLNGARVGQGPPPSLPSFYYYDEYDVETYFRTGHNCIAAIVHSLGRSFDPPPGLLAELADAHGDLLVGTDATWRASPATAWTSDTYCYRWNIFDPYQEVFDAHLAPSGWESVGFDDSEWERPVILAGFPTPIDQSTPDQPPQTAGANRLVPRDIPFMAEHVQTPGAVAVVEECLDLANRARPEDLCILLSMPGRPLRYSRVDGAENLCGEGGTTMVQTSTHHLDRVFDGIYDPCILLDFGAVITAYLEIELEGVVGGIVDVGYAERLIDGYFNNALEGLFANRYTMAEGRQRWRSFSWRAFRYVRLCFRRCSQPATIHAVRAIVTRYPFQAAGTFHSGDELLNAVFAICRATLRLCSHESIVDTPWREQAQWLAKFFRQSAATHEPIGFLSNITNAPPLPNMTPLADYSLWWVIGLWNHYLYTGESYWIRAYYPHVREILNAFLAHLDEHDLVADLPQKIIIDWADVDRRGACAALNALVYGALEHVVQMAHLNQDVQTAGSLQGIRERMRAAFPARLYDPARRCFADASVDGTLSPKVSEHANAAAIRWGLCDPGVAKGIAAAFYETKTVEYTEAQPFFTTVVLQALDGIDRFGLALRIIRDRWGKRMVERGATSTFEEWGMNGSWRSGEYSGFLRTLSHAWSAHPAEFLIRNIIGLEIVEPGCRAVRVRPRAVDFDYTVTFPTPLGPISVKKQGQHVERLVPVGVALIE
jgi:hypothetical protein